MTLDSIRSVSAAHIDNVLPSDGRGGCILVRWGQGLSRGTLGARLGFVDA